MRSENDDKTSNDDKMCLKLKKWFTECKYYVNHDLTKTRGHENG